MELLKAAARFLVLRRLLWRGWVWYYAATVALFCDLIAIGGALSAGSFVSRALE